MGKKLTKKVTWVGKVDWTLNTFHGEELSTHKGTSYNSYLIKDQKNVLIDTVWRPYDKEFVRNLKKEIDLDKIDFIVVNHGETDHSGALPELMREIPGTPIYCTANGIKSLKGHYHADWNFVQVKTGQELKIGESNLIFVEAPMLHWPDTMFTYMTGENILFSNDAFGQHYATELLYNDCVDEAELFYEAMKYYANILTPFSSQVIKKIKEVQSFNLPLDMICTSHGVIWRDRPEQIIERYLSWADRYSENQITVIFDTMWDSTRRMAELIAEGIRNIDKNVTIKLFHCAKDDKNDIVTEVFKSKAILVGSPAVNNGFLYSIGGMLEMLRGMKFKGKKAAAFGSYGWSGEAVKQIGEHLSASGFELINDGLRLTWVPDEKAAEECVLFGENFAKTL
ncbi:MAG: Anaerobic nitric oxide reductase flavorubredoxin [Firmicutes bacterium ADurb.Bin182]|nr:MAG: Anaerobic nitric oxide reductase flavorubredoxin [Firmicutes bacterium ADurb.Bin182]